jgi:general bacterial porin, GBP family
MKKTLLAAALLAGFAGAASAQSSVTLYGVVDLGYSYQNIKAPGGETRSQFAMASGQQSSSRWGLKGVEDLGNGLKVNFVYESGITANTGSSTNFTRQSTLGLTSSSWGSIDLGRRSSPGTWAFSGIDPFSASFGSAALDASMGAQFIRLSNMIMYTTPSVSGFGAAIGYSTDTGLTSRGTGKNTSPTFSTSNKMRALSVGARYANGPLLISAMYDTYMPASGSQNTTAAKQWNLGGTYDLKMVKIHAAYGQNIDGIVEGQSTINNAEISGGDENTGGGILFVPGARTNSWMLGLSAPVGGAGKVFANVQQMIPGGEFKETVGQLSSATQTTASIGYTYSMSKRTNLYAFYSYTNNVLMVNDVTANQVGVGIRHLF